MTGPARLFVYGTLRRGGGAPAELRELLAARTERLGTGPDLSRRETVRVRMEGDGTTEAWAYVYEGDARRLPEIESGDWLERGE